MLLFRHSVRTILKTSAHTRLVREHSATVVSDRSATVDLSWPKKKKKKSGVSVREPHSTSREKEKRKKKRKSLAENDWSNILPKSSQTRKKPPPLQSVLIDKRTVDNSVFSETAGLNFYSCSSHYGRVVTGNGKWTVRPDLVHLSLLVSTSDAKFWLGTIDMIYSTACRSGFCLPMSAVAATLRSVLRSLSGTKYESMRAHFRVVGMLRFMSDITNRACPLLFSKFCFCIYFCLYGRFNCISFHKFSRQLSVF